MTQQNHNRLEIKPLAESEVYRPWVKTHGSPLLLLDLHRLRQQYQKLIRALPGVDLFFAIKSLPNSEVISALDSFGCGFDIATSGEAALLQDAGVAARNAIHTHPVKRQQDIRDALRYGCTTFVVDNIWELEKFIPYRHRVRLLLRVSFPNPESPINLSRKFGCQPDEVFFLLQRAVSLGIRIKGLSFHAGSQSPAPDNHVHAIEQCRLLMLEYTDTTGKLLPILDIGGGFPVQYGKVVPDIDSFCEPIRKALGTLPDHIQVIAEPGRFLSAPAMTSVSTIMGKAKRSDATWYYLDDGLYGAYSGQIFDYATYPMTVFSDFPERETAVLAGPTCDSIDVIAENLQLPPLQIGDLVVGSQMGAYTTATSTDFNLFPRAKIITIDQILIQQQQSESIAG